MDLLLVSRRIGRVYIDVIRSNCQLFRSPVLVNPDPSLILRQDEKRGTYRS
jgi:hypothetical protein